MVPTELREVGWSSTAQDALGWRPSVTPPKRWRRAASWSAEEELRMARELRRSHGETFAPSVPAETGGGAVPRPGEKRVCKTSLLL